MRDYVVRAGEYSKQYLGLSHKDVAVQFVNQQAGSWEIEELPSTEYPHNVAFTVEGQRVTKYYTFYRALTEELPHRKRYTFATPQELYTALLAGVELYSARHNMFLYKIDDQGSMGYSIIYDEDIPYLVNAVGNDSWQTKVKPNIVGENMDFLSDYYTGVWIDVSPKQ